MTGEGEEGKVEGKDEREYGISRESLRVGSIKSVFQNRLLRCSASWWTPGSPAAGNLKKSNPNGNGWSWNVCWKSFLLPASLLALKLEMGGVITTFVE